MRMMMTSLTVFLLFADHQIPQTGSLNPPSPSPLRGNVHINELADSSSKILNPHDSDSANLFLRAITPKTTSPSPRNDLNVDQNHVGLSNNPMSGQEAPLKMEKSISSATSTVVSESVEYRLVNDLLSKYNKHVRPVIKPGDVTHVFVELSLFNVLKLDTKNQVLKTNTEFITKWMDAHLIWDPMAYQNITVIRLPFDVIWRPDIILYNTAESDYEAGILYTNAVIQSNGKVELVSHAIFSSICNVDIQWYPFDQQECHMSFASWTYDEVAIQLILGPADISDYHRNPEYFLENFYGEQVNMFNPCCQYPMSTIVFHLQFQRRTKFSVFFYLMPGILINLCAVMVFSLPAESGEKIGLGINSMLAMIVFLMAMTEKLPPTEKIPLAGLYYGICLTVITVNIAFSVFVLNMNFAGDRRRRIPRSLKIFIISLTRILGNRIPAEVQDAWSVDENKIFRTETLVKTFENPDHLDGTSLENRKESAMDNPPYENNYGDLKDVFQRRAIFALETMAMYAEKTEKRKMAKLEKESLRIQWKFISRVLDRFLFILFFLVTFFFNAIILTSSPFEEAFEYCPLGPKQCNDMTTEEIMILGKKMARKAAH